MKYSSNMFLRHNYSRKLKTYSFSKFETEKNNSTTIKINPLKFTKCGLKSWRSSYSVVKTQLSLTKHRSKAGKCTMILSCVNFVEPSVPIIDGLSPSYSSLPKDPY